MSRKLRETWLIVALGVALAITGLLAVRAMHFVRRGHIAEPIRPWMTVPYLAHSRHVPQADLWNALGITPHRHDRRPLGRIARDEKRPVEDVISRVRAAIEHAPKAEK